jgi:hypothetical protein
MSRTTKKRTGRIAVGLRTLFVLIVAMGFGLDQSLDQVRRRDRALKLVESRGGHWFPGPEIQSLPLTWRVLGAKPISYFFVSGDVFSEADCRCIEHLFPEAYRVTRLPVSVAAMNEEGGPHTESLPPGGSQGPVCA